MPQISAIRPQKSKKRINVYIDGKFGFGLNLQTLLKHSLKIDQELTDSEISSLVKESEFQTTYDKILMFASLRPRSEKEFRDWLNKHKVHESLNEELFNRLKKLELLDDKKFATWWVEQRIQFRPKSKRILGQELKIKGVGKAIIDDVIGEAKVDERSVVKKILEKKERFWKNLTGFEKRKKIFNYLASRGFDYETIRDVIGGTIDDET